MLDMIAFNTTGWDEQPREAHVRRWQKRGKGDGLGLYYFALPPDLGASLEQVDRLRFQLRVALMASHGGIIEHNVIQLEGLPVIRQIVKIPLAGPGLPPSGLMYIGSWTFPRRDFSYVLKVQCMEYGTTGMREAVVLDQELGRGHVQIGQDNRLINWFADPYEPTFEGTVLRNVADDERYDSQFPDHPLSRVRRYLNELEPTITISDAVKHAAAFLSPNRM